MPSARKPVPKRRKRHASIALAKLILQTMGDQRRRSPGGISSFTLEYTARCFLRAFESSAEPPSYRDFAAAARELGLWERAAIRRCSLRLPEAWQFPPTTIGMELPPLW